MYAKVDDEATFRSEEYVALLGENAKLEEAQSESTKDLVSGSRTVLAC